MEDYRQPVWAFFVILVWLVAGVALVASLGQTTSTLLRQVEVAGFLVTTLIMLRAVMVLMDREEKRLPLRTMAVVLVAVVVITVVVLLF